MANILDAILNIANDCSQKLGASTNTHNRLHAAGEPLEEYIKDAFAGTYNLDAATKNSQQSQVFSYGGGKNNPPDVIVRNGDAIEVKKVESIGGIALNSNYPKAKLYHDDPRISSDCRNIEGGQWTERDIIYAVCTMEQDSLRSVVFVYGSIYFAERDYYENQLNIYENTIHLNYIDPLGMSNVSCRFPTWTITHPFIAFNQIYEHNEKSDFELLAVIPAEKYNSFDNQYKLLDYSKADPKLRIQDGIVKNPNNLSQCMDVKVISYSYNNL